VCVCVFVCFCVIVCFGRYGFDLPGNQAAVLLSILSDDGSVLLTHSGCEIGQGITTKVIQTVAYGLGVPISAIQNTPTSTEKIPNFSMTGGSTTSESVCQAALNACSSLMTILTKYKSDGKTFADWVAAASNAGENLSVTGWFAPSAPGSGPSYNYYVYAAALTEVQVDVLSGETTILRVDIVYDCGQSLNPIVDIGQIEGAFTQGANEMMRAA
jgi:xanthine dehydrogenase/oxidase